MRSLLRAVCCAVMCCAVMCRPVQEALYLELRTQGLVARPDLLTLDTVGKGEGESEKEGVRGGAAGMAGMQ